MSQIVYMLVYSKFSQNRRKYWRKLHKEVETLGKQNFSVFRCSSGVVRTLDNVHHVLGLPHGSARPWSTWLPSWIGTQPHHMARLPGEFTRFRSIPWHDCQVNLQGSGVSHGKIARWIYKVQEYPMAW